MLTINADSPGERIVVALAVLSLCAEILADNECSTMPDPVTHAQCIELCNPYPVRRAETYACECATDQMPVRVCP